MVFTIVCPGQLAANFFLEIAMISGRAASKVISEGDIHGLSFTGSVEVGRLVYAAAAQNLIPVRVKLILWVIITDVLDRPTRQLREVLLVDLIM